MEESLSSEDIEFIHDIVVERFQITKGTINKNLLEAIVQRPNVDIKGGLTASYSPFDNVYSKAASIMEGIIRWHPFADGNKRTALLAVMYYLYANEYAIVLPLSSVRLTVDIARNQNTDEASTEILIQKISKWIKKHSGKNLFLVKRKVFFQISIPYGFLSILTRLGFKKFVYGVLGRWMAFDIYPEYAKEATNINEFLTSVWTTSVSFLEDLDKKLEEEIEEEIEEFKKEKKRENSTKKKNSTD